MKKIGSLIGLLFRWLFSGRRVTAKGYILRRFVSGKVQYEHRALAEEILDRRLKRWEVVHHINLRPYDNRPENLCVMHHRDHDRYHQWHDSLVKAFGKHPRTETRLQKLRGYINCIPLVDFMNKKTKSG